MNAVTATKATVPATLRVLDAAFSADESPRFGTDF